MSTPVFVLVCFVAFCAFSSILFLIVVVAGTLLREHRDEKRSERDERRSASLLYAPSGRDVCGTIVKSPRAVRPAAGMTRTRREGQRGHQE